MLTRNGSIERKYSYSNQRPVHNNYGLRKSPTLLSKTWMRLTFAIELRLGVAIQSLKALAYYDNGTNDVMYAAITVSVSIEIHNHIIRLLPPNHFAVLSLNAQNIRSKQILIFFNSAMDSEKHDFHTANHSHHCKMWLRCPLGSVLPVTRLLLQDVVPANSQAKKMKAPPNWFSVKRIHQLPEDSPCEGPLIRETLNFLT